MNFNHGGKGITVCRSILVVVFLAVIGSPVCLADQLQWNPRNVCFEAAQTIGRDSLLISYCSLSDADYVEVWLVQGAITAETSAEGLFEVSVLAKSLFRSQEPFSAVEFPVSADQWHFTATRHAGWTIEEIDLAYTYIYTGNSSFQCLGKVLELDCIVEVETISLPGDVMGTLLPRTRLGHHFSVQPFDFLPTRRISSSLPR